MIHSLLSIQLIVDHVDPGATIVKTWPLSGGISCTMTGVEVRRPDGSTQKLVVREVGEWSFQHYPESVHHEHQLLNHLAECGVAVANPRFCDTSCNILPRPYLVLDYVEGSPDLVTEDRNERAAIMAENLCKIHSVETSHGAFDFIQPSKVNIRPEGERKDETLQESKIREALTRVLPHVRENPSTFRHGDYWPGNMVWRDGKLAAVIDWEEVSIGDPLFDVAITRLDTLWAYGWEAMETFTREYQSRMDLDYTFLFFWDLRVSLRPMSNIPVWATSFPPLGRPDITEATMTQGHRSFVDHALASLSL